MRILITGGCGFLGSHIARQLYDMRHEILIIDRNISTSTMRLKDLKGVIPLVPADCNEHVNLPGHINKFKPHMILHLAAESVASWCDANPYRAMVTNIGGLINILSCSKDAGVKKFVFISSSFVYGDFQYVPADEGHPTNPHTVYGGTKVAGEAMVKAFCSRYDIDYSIVRPSAVYGPTDTNNRVVQVLLENAVKSKPLVLEGSEKKFDFTYIDDCVDGICLALLKKESIGEVFNITYGQGRSLKELAGIISRLKPTKILETEPLQHSPVRGELDISKAHKLIGYNPKWSLEDGVRIYYEWMVSK